MRTVIDGVDLIGTVADPALASRIRRSLLQTRDASPRPSSIAGATPDGFGEAGRWARRFCIDIREFQHGRLAWRDVESRIVLADPDEAGALDLVHRLAGVTRMPVHRVGPIEFPVQDRLDGDMVEKLRSRVSSVFAGSPTIVVVELPEHRPNVDTDDSGQASPFADLLFDAVEGIEPAEGFPIVTIVPAMAAVRRALRHPHRLGRVVHVDFPSVRDLARALSDELGVLPLEFLLRPIRHLQGTTDLAGIVDLARDIRRRAREADRPVRPEDVLHVACRDERSAPERLRVAVNVAGRVVALLADARIPELATVLGSITCRSGSAGPTVHGTSATELGDRDVSVQLLAGKAAEKLMLGHGSAGETDPLGSFASQPNVGPHGSRRIDRRVPPPRADGGTSEAMFAYAHADAATLMSERISDVAEMTAMLLENLSLDRNELLDFALRTGLVRDEVPS